MRRWTEKLERFLELGGVKKDVWLLVISGIALVVSMYHPVRRADFAGGGDRAGHGL